MITKINTIQKGWEYISVYGSMEEQARYARRHMREMFDEINILEKENYAHIRHMQELDALFIEGEGILKALNAFENGHDTCEIFTSKIIYNLRKLSKFYRPTPEEIKCNSPMK